MSFFLAEIGYAVLGMGLLKAYNADWGRFNKNLTFLSRYTTDLTAQARNGQVKQAYGREKELTELKSAVAAHGIVVLVGDPGVGKTAIVEELARKTASREVSSLNKTSVFKLDFEKVSGSQGLKGILESVWSGKGHEFFKQLFTEL